MESQSSFFVRVDYSEFKKTRRDIISEGDVLAIVHAASIDEKGRVHPTEYYLRRVDPLLRKPRLVA